MSDIPDYPLPHEVMDLALRQVGSVDVKPLMVERSDGHTSVSDLRWWLRDADALPPWDVVGLELVPHGPVLDVGCATGRHLDLLRSRGIIACGIDLCPTAVSLARAEGHACIVADAWRHQVSRPFAAVLALGGNLGIAEEVERVPAFLSRLAAATVPGGVMVVSSVDWRRSADRHEAHLRQQRELGRYPGDAWLRLRLGEVVSRWFPWAWIDLDTLRTSAASSGLAVTDVLEHGSKYIARLVRPTSR